MTANLKNALIRTLRTYLVVAIPALIAVLTTTGPVDWSAWKVALLSGVPAALNFLWITVLDPSSLPSLTVPDKK
jgi:hypothetical protein